jgi:anaerobic magnesium-protoporphyrin IX monomethyl ester cyclase
MNGLDFLFVFPTASEGFDCHLGAAYIRAYLKARGVRSGQFLHPGNVSLDDIAERMLECRPRIVGFSCYDANYPRVKVLAERIRRFSQSTVMVCGGPAATFSDRVILEDCPSMDCCVRYEGEETALELLEWVNGQRPVESIRGITYRSSSGVCRTADRGPAGGESGSLDELRDPYLEGMVPAADARKVGLITSRGCTFPCTYCNSRTVSRGRIRYHSVERVVSVLCFLDRELDGASDAKTVITFNDDNLSLDRGRLHLLLRRMAELQFRNLMFGGMMRPDHLAENSLSLLRDAGFAVVHFGVESAVPQILGTIKRVRPGGGEKDDYRREKVSLERAAWAVEKAKRAGLQTTASVILGLPGETEEQGRETLEYVRRLDVDKYYHNLLQVRAGTELERTCGDFGIHVEPAASAPLPPRTRLAYPAHRLPLLDNEYRWPASSSTEMFLVLRLLTGAREACLGAAISQSGVGACGPVLGMSKQAPASAVCDWLSDELPYGSVVCLINDGPEPSESLQSPMLDGVPFLVYTLRGAPQAAGGYCWRLNELDVDAPAENSMSIRVIPFAGVDWTDLTGLVNPVRGTLLLSTNTGSDVEAMERFLAVGEPAGRWRLPAAALESCLSLADGCRWAGAPCPAAEGFRWFIDGSGNLSPCRCGGPVGQVGDSPPALRQAVEEIERAEAEKRNCATCPVSASCSRCLFPEPLGTARFCELRQRHPDLPVFVDGLVLARLLSQVSLVPEGASSFTIHSLRGRLRGEFALDGGPVALSECLLLSFDGAGSGFLCHSRRKLLVPVAGDQLRTLEALVHAA